TRALPFSVARGGGGRRAHDLRRARRRAAGNERTGIPARCPPHTGSLLVGVRRATSRYACSLAALIVMILCPVATLAWYIAVIPAPTDAAVWNVATSDSLGPAALDVKTLLKM